MPIYEYRCGACGRKSSFFTRSISDRVEAVCPQCSSRDMRRVISAVSFRTASSGAPDDSYYRDPSNIGRHAEESFERFGMDMPESVHETIENARQGVMPEELDL